MSRYMTPGVTGFFTRKVWNTMLKMLGAVLVALGFGGLGYFFSDRVKEHLCTLIELKKSMYLLKSQILYAQSPLYEALEIIGKRSDRRISNIFLEVSIKIKERSGVSFSEVWCQEIDKLGRITALYDEDKKQLKSFGEQLGYLDLKQQERTLLLYIEQLNSAIENAGNSKREKCRLYTGIGVLAGLFFAIVLY